jgi:Uma2 family endonuclease
MDWLEVTEHPSLRDLPFKIELNEYGAIVMSPVKLNHSVYQGEIGYFLRVMRPDGKVSVEFAVATPQGTKVADVAWISHERWQSLKGKTEADIAPEVCVEVLSASNTDDEIKTKRKLYFAQGANEVWACDPYGQMSFYNAKGRLKRSVMFPDFPDHIEI